MKLKHILMIIIVGMFITTLFYLLFSPLKSTDIPDGIWDDYNSMGVQVLDFITPMVIKIFFILLCITILILCIINRNRLLKSLSRVTTEKWLVFFSFLSWYILNDALNFQGGSPRGIYEIGIFFGNSGTPVIEFIYIGFVVSLFLLVGLFLREYWDGKSSNHKWDFIGIILGILGYGLMATAIFHQLYLGACGACEILFGLTRGTIYHIGLLCYLGSLIYYLATEKNK